MIESRINILERQVEELLTQLSIVISVNNRLEKELKEKDRIIETLSSEIAELRRPKKNSSNSSVPPFQDQYKVKPNQSLRKRSGKKPGGQKDHKGTTLKMTDSPDTIKEYKSEYCSECGKVLQGEQRMSGRRQVIDIPPIQPIITEHRIYSTQCSCGKCNLASYPETVKAPISYGVNVKSLIGYYSVAQYIPTARIAEILSQTCGIKMSTGTVDNQLTKLSEQCATAYEAIRLKVESAAVAGTDETGCVIDGDKAWMWAWQTALLTYIAASMSRGFKTVEENFPNGLTQSILVSDCWAAQLKTPSKAKQLCTAHIQRELKYFIDSCKNYWSKKFLKLIYEALDLKRQMLAKPHLHGTNHFDKLVESIKNKCRKLLEQKAKGPKKMQALKKRMFKHKDSLWQFLDHLNVPPDNNGSERAIRNVKVKQKVSGQFRSMHGAKRFAILRSIYDTARKNGCLGYQAFAKAALIPS